MLTASEILDACDAIDRGGAEGALAVIVNRKRLVDHLRRLYSTDSSREGIEAALREAGFDRYGNTWWRGDTEVDYWAHDNNKWSIRNQGAPEYRSFTTVGELLHLIAAAELAREGGE